jgi:nicotinamide mononucleotide transporter
MLNPAGQSDATVKIDTGAVIIAFLSAVLILATWQGWVKLDRTETLGFVTGAACVYLVVKEHVWNFPIGIANNIVFFVLFTRASLFADAGLQVIFLALAAHGWYAWLHGGPNREPLWVHNAPPRVLLACLLAVAVGTFAIRELLLVMKGAAPFLDAFTTALSLTAQYLLNRKFIENWMVWITADVLYVYMYFTKGLPLTAVLYAGFIGLCVMGWRQWRSSMIDKRAVKQMELELHETWSSRR